MAQVLIRSPRASASPAAPARNCPDSRTRIASSADDATWAWTPDRRRTTSVAGRSPIGSSRGGASARRGPAPIPHATGRAPARAPEQHGTGPRAEVQVRLQSAARTPPAATARRRGTRRRSALSNRQQFMLIEAPARPAAASRHPQASPRCRAVAVVGHLEHRERTDALRRDVARRDQIAPGSNAGRPGSSSATRSASACARIQVVGVHRQERLRRPPSSRPPALRSRCPRASAWTMNPRALWAARRSRSARTGSGPARPPAPRLALPHRQGCSARSRGTAGR